MLGYFKCTKCWSDVEFEPKDYKVVKTEKVICSNCGAEYYIKNSPIPSYKEKLKAFGIGLGKFAYKAAEFGFNTLKNMQQEYDSAQDKLRRQGLDEWDEEELTNRARYAGFYEETIIRQRLRELKDDDDN